MQEKVSFMFFSVHMEMSAPWDNCFGRKSVEPRYPPNTVIPRDGNFDSHLKPMKDTYNPWQEIISVAHYLQRGTTPMNDSKLARPFIDCHNSLSLL